MSHLLVVLAVVTETLTVPKSAHFCLGWCDFGISGWAAGQDGTTSKSKLTQPRSMTTWDTLYCHLLWRVLVLFAERGSHLLHDVIQGLRPLQLQEVQGHTFRPRPSDRDLFSQFICCMDVPVRQLFHFSHRAMCSEIQEER